MNDDIEKTLGRLRPRQLHSTFLKSLMQNLIYPAVLGSLLYTALQVIATPAVATIARWRRLEIAFDPITATWNWQKVAFLLIVLVFYHCDYLYLAYTKVYGAWFFAADLVFLCAMYVTLVAINPTGAKPVVSVFIAGASLFFVAIYLAWDFYEFRQATAGDEKGFYLKVLVWEALSFVALLLNSCAWPRSFGGTSPLLFILGVSTVAFCMIVVKKKQFFERDLVKQQDPIIVKP